jgi:hypothetical protein
MCLRGSEQKSDFLRVLAGQSIEAIADSAECFAMCLVRVTKHLTGLCGKLSNLDVAVLG